jgi:hypothetical protein
MWTLPSQPFLQGVQREGNWPVDGGRFSDIYKGNYNGKEVAIKYLRFFTEKVEAGEVR